MIRLLPDVDPTGIRPEILLALLVAHDAYAKYTVPCWITSVVDGVHKPDSFHYRGLAVDLRVKHLARDAWESLRTEIADALGPRYDVLLELTPPHLHIEYDPKEPARA